jgi:nucleotide-binding universal stress UspA family protein
VAAAPAPLAPPAEPSTQEPEGHRVQVLFRPEDVALEADPGHLGCPVLGEAVVESRVLVGPTERLRLRVALPGVRAIAPPVPYGADYVLVEASRSQHHTWRLPLLPGARTWVGLRRVHALTHPGLSLLAARTDADPAAPSAALALAGAITRLAQARLAVLLAEDAAALGESGVEPARAELPGGGVRLAVDLRPEPLATALVHSLALRTVDLLVLGGAPEVAVERVEAGLASGDAHVLWVPHAAPPSRRGKVAAWRSARTGGSEGAIPTRALICAAVGEPGKQDVAFAGRLLRHLGARATVFTVLVASDDPASREQAVRFLEAGVRTLRRLGIEADADVESGPPAVRIADRQAQGGYDLLVLGAPLPEPGGTTSLRGVTARLLRETQTPLLVVRSGGPQP